MSPHFVRKEDKAVEAEIVDFSWLLKVCPDILIGVFFVRRSLGEGGFNWEIVLSGSLHLYGAISLGKEFKFE